MVSRTLTLWSLQLPQPRLDLLWGLLLRGGLYSTDGADGFSVLDMTSAPAYGCCYTMRRIFELTSCDKEREIVGLRAVVAWLTNIMTSARVSSALSEA